MSDVKPGLPSWRGVTVWKYPGDFLLYQQEIYRNRPDWIVETGTKMGGSALFLGDMLEMIGEKGKVISIDISAHSTPQHGRVVYLKADSGEPATASLVKRMIDARPGKVMVILDSLHFRHHVWKELQLFAGLVTVGQALVVEDCCVFPAHKEPLVRPKGPEDALLRFLETTKNFEREYPENQFRKNARDEYPASSGGPVYIAYSITTHGWLRRVR